MKTRYLVYRSKGSQDLICTTDATDKASAYKTARRNGFILPAGAWAFREPEAHFWANVDRRGPDECWLWNVSVSNNGYGNTRHEKRQQGSHRVAWLLERGPIPKGLLVLHRCDVRACCNPSHLFLGTLADNMADMVAKGRQSHANTNPVRGSAHVQAKLVEEDIPHIRRLSASGISSQNIANIFGVSRTAVYQIVERKRWKHVA